MGRAPKREKTLLFSLTKKDFVVETFRCGGHGGQHVDKTSSGVRITHPASGAVGESRDDRSQAQNKKIAFTRLVQSQTFKAWHKMECARRSQSQRAIEEAVDKAMAEENLQIDYFVPDK